MLVYSEDTQALAENAREVVESLSPRSRSRQHLERFAPDRELWEQMVELGWTAIPFSEEQGGLGLGLPEVVVVMEALGRQLAPTPMLSLMLGGRLAPSEEVLTGEVVALTSEARWEDGLVGSPRALDASGATRFVVPTPEGLYRVDREQVRVEPLRRLDGRDFGVVHLEGASGVLLEGDLDRIRDEATVALCGEMLGGMRALFELTLDYLKIRKQFGVPIGSFQVLQHRAVDAFIQIELAQSAVMAAALEPTPERVSLAKARCSDTWLLVCHESIQLHGGVGMTAEHDAGLFLKRARVCANTLGTSAWHRDRFARIRGY